MTGRLYTQTHSPCTLVNTPLRDITHSASSAAKVRIGVNWAKYLEDTQWRTQNEERQAPITRHHKSETGWRKNGV